MNQVTHVSLSEAARIAGVSLSTAKRRTDALRDAGASQDARGRWLIPMHAVSVLRGSSDPKPEPSSDPSRTNEVDQLRAQLADAERRAAVAEALAAERAERIAAMDQQLSTVLTQAQQHAAELTALDAARQVERLRSNDPESVQKSRTPEPEPQRRRWFKRRRTI